MCVNSPVEVVAFLGNKKAFVRNYRDEEAIVSLEFLGCTKIGDYVFVQSGFALKKAYPQKSRYVFALLNEIENNIQSVPFTASPQMTLSF